MTSKRFAVLCLAGVAAGLMGMNTGAQTTAAKPEKTGATNSKLLEYKKSLVLGKGDFRGIGGVCVDHKDNIYVVGAKLLKIYDPAGKETKSIKLDIQASGVAVSEKGDIFVCGVSDGARVARTPAVVKYDASGDEKARWADNLKDPTGIAVYKNFVLVADSQAAAIHKFDTEGKFVADIGSRPGAKRGMFSTCCGILDFGVDSAGNLHVGDLGGHRVVTYSIDGKRGDFWGKHSNAEEDFCGCCNPVSVAVAKNGVVITAEKTIPRVKVYSAGGKKLLAVVGLKDFDKNCGSIDLAIDSKMRILAVDDGANCVLVFDPPAKGGSRN
jgi:hypothetical protein